jgi:predicted ATPase
MVAMVDDLVARGPICEAMADAAMPGEDWTTAALPDGLRRLLEGQVERLDPREQQVLGAGSVAGMEFSAALVADAEGRSPAQVEEVCERLVGEELFLRVQPSPWNAPERRASQRYRFRHALHREVLCQRLRASERRSLHRSIAAWMESAFGARRVAIAAELAMHFELGGESARALHYRAQEGSGPCSPDPRSGMG